MGTLTKYTATAQIAASSKVGESLWFLLDYLLRFLRVAVLLALWQTLFAGRGTVSGMSLETVLAYVLIAEVFAEQLACSVGIEEMVWNGTLVGRFLRPMSLAGVFTAEMVGRWLPGLCFFSVPLLLVAPLLGVDPRPDGAMAALLFAVSLALAVIVGLAIEVLFATLMLWLDLSMWLVGHLRGAIYTLLSGGVVPLALMPWGIGKIVAWLPFASTASAPLLIYTGRGDAARLIGLQAAWAVVMVALAGRAWAARRERLSSHGG
jgi:ABC-2 type transport system permease protein